MGPGCHGVGIDTSSPTPPFDPHTVPVTDAATVMLVADRPELEVLLVRRTARLAFAADAWVFPGGRVDPGDRRVHGPWVGRSETDAARAVDADAHGLSFWVTSARETIEEAGVLLGRQGHGSISEVRAGLEAGRDFADLLEAGGHRLDFSDVEFVARFITPVGSPRRFDARFFVAPAPADAAPEHDDGEIVDWDWFRPSEALERYRAGEMTLISPTVRMLACLARYDSVDQVMAVARADHPMARVRVIDPAGAYVVVLPGEPGYETAELEVESGWVKLWEPDGRPGRSGLAGRPW